MNLKLNVKKRRAVIIVSALVLFIGISFAYVVAQLSGGTTGNVNVTADTTDNLQFSIDKEINLNPTQFNVLEGGGGLSDTSVGTATLLANSTTNNFSTTYYVYFQINSNNYIYTTEDNKPEIVLTIMDPNGNLITELPNNDLTYVEVENADGSEVKGFDITTASGLFNVASDYVISSNSSTNATAQDWTFKVTFINLITNQSANGGSTLDAEIILSKDERYTLAKYIIEKVYVEDGVNGLYYHDGTGTYGALEAEDNAYRFAGGDYEITDSHLDTYSHIYNEIVLANCDNELQSIGNVDCDSGNLYFTLAYDSSRTQYSTMESALEKAIEDGYITKNNVKNNICFGTEEAPCPKQNLYRIIGIFDNKVKLIQNSYATVEQLGTDGEYNGVLDYFKPPFYPEMNAGDYSWSSNYNNDSFYETGYYNIWNFSDLNITNLNVNYINYLGNWKNLIEDADWNVGGIDETIVNGGDYNIRHSVKSIYDSEVGPGKVSSAPFEPYNAKIGLMYVSDYLYASNPQYWGEMNFGIIDLGTLMSESYLNPPTASPLLEWTLSRYRNKNDMVFTVYIGAAVGGSSQYGLGLFLTRPVFYLKTNVEYISGDGSQENPYRIA